MSDLIQHISPVRALENLVVAVDAIRVEAARTSTFTQYDDHFLKAHLMEARRVLRAVRAEEEYTAAMYRRTIHSDLLEDR